VPKPVDEPPKTRERDASGEALIERVPDALESTTEPPVVARLVVEIRSDGSRTIARGAMEDAQRGERVSIEARGDSPIQLAIALARALTQLPRLGARSAVRGLLGKRRDK
jgi:hypothetical protein